MALAGCKTATDVKPMTVHVRDQATQQPIEGATVSTCVAHLFVPYEPGLTDMVGWFDTNPNVRTITVTDSQGVASIEAVNDCPVKIVIARAGYAPLEAFMRGYPSAAASDEWIDPGRDLGTSSGPRLEARFEQTAQ
jgi:hypothetical protein